MDKAAIEALVERQLRAWMDGDLDAIVADYGDDAVFIAPAGRWQGPAAIRDAAAAFFAHAHDVRITLHSVLVDGERGALEWRWSERRRGDGRRYGSEDAILFIVRDGLIRYWREYFNTADLAVPEHSEDDTSPST